MDEERIKYESNARLLHAQKLDTRQITHPGCVCSWLWPGMGQSKFKQSGAGKHGKAPFISSDFECKHKLWCCCCLLKPWSPAGCCIVALTFFECNQTQVRVRARAC